MLKDNLPKSEFFGMFVERWILENKILLLFNFILIFVSCALGSNPLWWALSYVPA